jgi:hypothetical protein
MHVPHDKPTSIPLLLAAAALAIGTYVLAGDLEPPGPPEPTMKTLTDVEPRIPIYAGDLPLTISESGSYYLAENVTTNGDGIRVAVGNVTIDLMGHSLAGGTGEGINVAGAFRGIHIVNGTVRDWENAGIYLQSFDSTVREISAIGNGGAGIVANESSIVVDCIATTNEGDGIYLTSGIVHRCESAYNGGNGIFTGRTSTISGCSTHDNDLNGIRVDGGAFVVGNNSTSNGAPGSEASGIFAHSIGYDSRIERNHLATNDGYGLHLEGSSNTAFCNSARGNGIQDYLISAGNDVGPIGTAATATSPWANISY